MINSIERTTLIAVEGKDEINFIKALFKHIKPDANFDIMEVGGKQQFNNKIPVLKRVSGFSDVDKFLIICDADDNAENTFKGIINLLRKEKLPTPLKVNTFSKGTPQVCIFLMPGSSENGMLEDLCLKTVKDNPAMKCVNSFIDCAKGLGEPPKNIAKAKAQAYLAAMPKILSSVGIAAQKGY